MSNVTESTKAATLAKLLLDPDTYAHTERVAQRVSRGGAYLEYAAAWLHDVVEDTACTPTDLHRLGFSAELVNLVSLLTRDEGVTYRDYILRISRNLAATRVKLADLDDNLNGRPTPPPASLEKRYRNAQQLLACHTALR